MVDLRRSLENTTDELTLQRSYAESMSDEYQELKNTLQAREQVWCDRVVVVGGNEPRDARDVVRGAAIMPRNEWHVLGGIGMC